MTTKAELVEINKMHDHLEQLEQQGRFEEADAYFEKHRWAFDFNRKGHWVGSVANENGWTA